MKLEDAMAAGGLFLLCGVISGVWELFIYGFVYLIHSNGADHFSSPELIPMYLDLWSVPLLVIGLFHLLFSFERWVKVSTVAGVFTPALITIFPLLWIFYG